MCAKWVEVQLFVEKYRPDNMYANRAVYIFNDNAMMHFRNILPRIQKHVALDKLLVKKARKRTAGEEELTASERQRREKRQEENYSVLYGGELP